MFAPAFSCGSVGKTASPTGVEWLLERGSDTTFACIEWPAALGVVVECDGPTWGPGKLSKVLE
jgi:hypothetical protein